MNLWDAIDRFGVTITDDKLRAAWSRMLETKSIDDCEYAAYVAEYRSVGASLDAMRIASRAADLVRAEQRVAHALISAGVQP
jgi:hypothetical protein